MEKVWEMLTAMGIGLVSGVVGGASYVAIKDILQKNEKEFENEFKEKLKEKGLSSQAAEILSVLKDMASEPKDNKKSKKTTK